MRKLISRLGARPVGTALLFFVAGVLYASAMDWTPETFAQQSTKPTSAAVKSLEETSNAFVSIAEHVTPAVVAVQTQRMARANDIPRELRGIVPVPQGLQEGTGSGFVVSADGYIVTNNHVVADAERISVLMSDRKSYPARLVGRDPQTDVAVLKIDAKNLPTVALGNDEALRIGEWVLAIGNPLGLDFTVTAGIVSAKGRSSNEVPVTRNQWAITDFIQTDAAINRGNSGGPLVNIRGEVIGINTAIASETGTYTGYGFAIPIGLAKVVWEDLVENGSVRRAALGVNIREVSAEDAEVAGLKEIRGAHVAGCTPDSIAPSAACKAGVKQGDVIIALDGRPVDRVSGLQRIVRAKRAGDEVKVTVMRYGSQMDFRVKLASAVPDTTVVASAGARNPNRESNPAEKLGIEVAPLSEAFIRDASVPADYRGLQVVDVDLTGPARRLLAPDRDIIVAVLPAQTPIRSAEDLRKAIAAKRSGEILSLSVYDAAARQTRAVNIRIGGQQ
jgi:serine protease Do